MKWLTHRSPARRLPIRFHSSILGLPALVAALVTGVLSVGCIESNCTHNEDCPDGEVCLTSTGNCITPECTEHEQCGEGLICETYRCVEGCVSREDCRENQECFNHHCFDVEPQCECPLAPEFCAQDLNPRSETSGQQLCFPEASPTGMALFFGSIGCSICRSSFGGLLQIRQELEDEGQQPILVFVQLKTRIATAIEVASTLGAVDAPVVQDSDSLGIWEAYNADWYHVVIVDAQGCLAGHFESVTLSTLAGTLAGEIKDTWRTAMSAECSTPTE